MLNYIKSQTKAIKAAKQMRKVRVLLTVSWTKDVYNKWYKQYEIKVVEHDKGLIRVDLCGSLCQVLQLVSDATGDEPPTERVTDQSLRVSLCTSHSSISTPIKQPVLSPTTNFIEKQHTLYNWQNFLLREAKVILWMTIFCISILAWSS